jgi:hypothetical protein
MLSQTVERSGSRPGNLYPVVIPSASLDHTSDFYHFGGELFSPELTGDQPLITVIRVKSNPALEAEKKSLIQALSAELSKFEEVYAIYYEGSEERMNVTVLLDHESYDDQLMDAMLDKEFEIRESINILSVDVLYVPLLGREIGDLVPGSARRIYKRD